MRRVLLLVLELFVAATATAGAVYVVPGLPADWIKWGPFDDVLVPAVALGLVAVLSDDSRTRRRSWRPASGRIV